MLQTIDDVMQSLRTPSLLRPEQLQRLASEEITSFEDPQALLKHLIKSGWLTLFQGKKILAGRGAELVFGPYVILDKLGEGGMGMVFKARHTRMDRLVALKVVRPSILSNPNALRRYRREVVAAAKLNHPNIVRLYDADEIDGQYFLAMEFVDGEDLSSLVRSGGSLPVLQACDFIRQAALGLQHAQDEGFVHRDIKPSNLLVTRGAKPVGGVVKILDMGLARPQFDESDSNVSAVTQDGTVVGTPDFMAPEQAKNSRTVDHRADLYSLGCTFFYLLTGKPPFPEGTTMEKLLRHQMDPPPAIQALRPDVRPEIAAILTRLLAKKPEDRFQSGAALVEALQPFLPIPASSTSTSSTRLVPKPIVASGGSAPVPASGGSPTASGGYAVPASAAANPTTASGAHAVPPNLAYPASASATASGATAVPAGMPAMPARASPMAPTVGSGAIPVSLPTGTAVLNVIVPPLPTTGMPLAPPESTRSPFDFDAGNSAADGQVATMPVSSAAVAESTKFQVQRPTRSRWVFFGVSGLLLLATIAWLLSRGQKPVASTESESKSKSESTSTSLPLTKVQPKEDDQIPLLHWLPQETTAVLAMHPKDLVGASASLRQRFNQIEAIRHLLNALNDTRTLDKIHRIIVALQVDKPLVLVVEAKPELVNKFSEIAHEKSVNHETITILDRKVELTVINANDEETWYLCSPTASSLLLCKTKPITNDVYLRVKGGKKPTFQDATLAPLLNNYAPKWHLWFTLSGATPISERSSLIQQGVYGIIGRFTFHESEGLRYEVTLDAVDAEKAQLFKALRGLILLKIRMDKTTAMHSPELVKFLNALKIRTEKYDKGVRAITDGQLPAKEFYQILDEILKKN